MKKIIKSYLSNIYYKFRGMLRISQLKYEFILNLLIVLFLLTLTTLLYKIDEERLKFNDIEYSLIEPIRGDIINSSNSNYIDVYSNRLYKNDMAIKVCFMNLSYMYLLNNVDVGYSSREKFNRLRYTIMAYNNTISVNTKHNLSKWNKYLSNIDFEVN